MNSLSDNQLMEEVREGKIEKMAVIFERHHVRLFNFYLRLTGNRSHSEDLIQEVFYRMLKYRSTYRGESKFIIWMYQIARNAHIDYLRKKKSELPLEEKGKEAVSPEPSPLEKAERDQDIALMRKALSELPWKRREVLVLSRFQNMKYKEIAELMECRIGTVKAQVHRAIKELGRIYFELSGRTVP